MPMLDSLINLESIAAVGLAINLAYLNLPNLRFADRLKNKIRLLMDGYDRRAFSSIQQNDSAYSALFIAGNLQEIASLHKPSTGVSPHQGDILVQLFMRIWCTPVALRYKKQQKEPDVGTVPTDKIISSVLLVVSASYLYAMAAIKAGAGASVLTPLFVLFVIIPALGVITAQLIRQDYTNGLIVFAALVFSLNSMFFGYLGLWIDPVSSALTVLVLCVALTTVLVLISAALYQSAETHYSLLVKQVMTPLVSGLNQRPKQG
jgi:hypothetical protein